MLPLLAQPGVLRAPDTEFHLYNMQQFGKEMQSGVLYPRWLGEWFWGYGSPLSIYYQSLPYMFGGFLINLGISSVLALKLTVWVALLTMGWFMYYFSRQFLPTFGALLAAVFYQTSPYYLLSLYINMTLPSYVALLWLPLILLLIMRCSNQPSVTAVILLGIACAGLIMSHLLVAMMMSPVMVIFGLYMIYQQRQRASAFLALAGAGILGILLASIYLLPAIFENELLYVDWYTSGNNWSSYKNNFLFNMPLTGDDMGLTLAANTLVGIGSILNSLLVAFIAGYYLRRNPAADPKRRSIALLVTAIFAFTTFMAYKPSEPIYEVVSALSLLQFPWRWQAISALMAAYMAGEAFTLVIESRKNLQTQLARLYSYTTMAVIAVTIAFGFIIIYIAVVMFGPMPAVDLAAIVSNTPSESTFFHRNFLPATASHVDFADLQEANPLVSSDPPATIAIQQWASPYRSFTVEADTATTVKIHTFNFPGWTVAIDGTPVDELLTAEEDGALLFDVPPGQSQVTATFESTPVRKIGEGLSLVSGVLCLGGLIFLGIRQRRQTAHLMP